MSHIFTDAFEGNTRSGVSGGSHLLNIDNYIIQRCYEKQAEWKHGERQCQAEAADSSWWILKEVQERKQNKKLQQQVTAQTRQWLAQVDEKTGFLYSSEWVDWRQVWRSPRCSRGRKQTHTDNLGREETQGKARKHKENTGAESKCPLAGLVDWDLAYFSGTYSDMLIDRSKGYNNTLWLPL